MATNPAAAFLTGALAVGGAIYATQRPCTVNDSLLDKLTELTETNGGAVKAAQKSLTEQLKALNDLPADKAEALKAIRRHQDEADRLAERSRELEAAAKRLDDERKALKDKPCQVPGGQSAISPHDLAGGDNALAGKPAYTDYFAPAAMTRPPLPAVYHDRPPAPEPAARLPLPGSAWLFGAGVAALYLAGTRRS